MKCHECPEVKADVARGRTKFFIGNAQLTKDLKPGQLRNEAFTLPNDRELVSMMVTFANERLALSDQVLTINNDLFITSPSKAFEQNGIRNSLSPNDSGYLVDILPRTSVEMFPKTTPLENNDSAYIRRGLTDVVEQG